MKLGWTMVISALPEIVTQPIYSATAVLSHERDVANCMGIKLVDLMECAGKSVFDKTVSLYPKANSLLVLCGKGNNGGDGYVVARLASKAGMNVSVLMMVDDDVIKGDALIHLNALRQTNARIYSRQNIEIVLNNVYQNAFDVVIDGLFGIGFKGQMQEPFVTLIEQINHYPVDVISIDVPSGVNASSGEVSTIAMNAKATISFIVLKKGLLSGPALDFIGDLYLADLNLRENFIARIESQCYWQGPDHLPKLLPIPQTQYKSKNGR